MGMEVGGWLVARPVPRTSAVLRLGKGHSLVAKAGQLDLLLYNPVHHIYVAAAIK